MQLIAFVAVYFVLYDVLEELCNEFEDQPPEDERLQFASIEACLYNMRIVVGMSILVGCLIYFPLKIHFALVLRALCRLKEDQ